MSVKCKKPSEDYLILRLVAAPYLIFLVIVLFQFILLTPYVLRTHDWISMVYVIIESLLLLSFICYSIRYRIWWQDGKIFQKAADKSVTSIDVNEIKKIRRESSGVQSPISFSRPSVRLTLYGGITEGPKFIDISLIHFNVEDTKKLMKMIQEKRPDLEMPKGWG